MNVSDWTVIAVVPAGLLMLPVPWLAEDVRAGQGGHDAC